MFPASFFNEIFLLILGLLIGSFLNVVIYRLPHKKKILNLHSRSQCPHCKKTLKFFDLIPVLSFLWLKGRCRYCQKKISIQYPVVEMTTALTFIGIGHWGQGSVVFLMYLIAVALIVIFFVDLNTRYIYDVTLWILFLAALGWVLLNQVFFTHLMAALAAGLFFYLLSFLGKKVYGKQALGEGDIPLAALLAFLAGPSLALIGFYCAFILGGAVALFLLVTGKVKRDSELAFAPFLISGWVLAVIGHVF